MKFLLTLSMINLQSIFLSLQVVILPNILFFFILMSWCIELLYKFSSFLHIFIWDKFIRYPLLSNILCYTMLLFGLMMMRLELESPVYAGGIFSKQSEEKETYIT